jgi:hypothetical protein
VIFSDARLSEPDVGRRIARTQAQRLADVSLGLFGATGKDLAKSDERMGVSEISIQRQRMFTLGNAFEGALRQDLDIPQERMAARMVWEG